MTAIFLLFDQHQYQQMLLFDLMAIGVDDNLSLISFELQLSLSAGEKLQKVLQLSGANNEIIAAATATTVINFNNPIIE